eukprot:CAMPEP_0185737482 /NCGR_PEP_ID=MMETSP1171-20130828/30501_1 /TAXON_ID=374046 /ORGANISM="Helicotheca tamensis, Strain CCMP826" /LENGTH=62 /DNA_ID=CAMNT_0028408407 /DNA_START=104 /DNA_END=289 /DNA_ORIENTATION=+
MYFKSAALAILLASSGSNNNGVDAFGIAPPSKIQSTSFVPRTAIVSRSTQSNNNNMQMFGGG